MNRFTVLRIITICATLITASFANPIAVYPYDTLFAATAVLDSAATLGVLPNSQDTVAMIDKGGSISFDSVWIGGVSGNYHLPPVYIGVWIASRSGHLTGTLSVMGRLKANPGLDSGTTIATRTFSVPLQIDSTTPELVLLPVSFSPNGLYNVTLIASGLDTIAAVKKLFFFTNETYSLNIPGTYWQNRLTVNSGTTAAIVVRVPSFCRMLNVAYSFDTNTTWNTLAAGAIDSIEWHVPDTSLYGVTVRLTYCPISMAEQPSTREYTVDIIKPGCKSIYGVFGATSVDSTSPNIQVGQSQGGVFMPDSSWILFRSIDFASGMNLNAIIDLQTNEGVPWNFILAMDSLSSSPVDSFAASYWTGSYTISLGLVSGVHSLFIEAFSPDVSKAQVVALSFSPRTSGSYLRYQPDLPGNNNSPGHVIAGSRYAIFPLSLSGPGFVQVKVFSLGGRILSDMNLYYSQGGRHNYVWDYSAGNAQKLPAGKYIVSTRTRSSLSSCALFIPK